MSLLHDKTATRTTPIRPADWNAAHVFSGGLDGQYLTRDTSAASGWAWANAVEVIDVRAYGATGDGVTNDRAAIQAAIDAASAAGGGPVFVPNGTFLVGSTVNVKNRVQLIGTGRGSILKASSGVGATPVTRLGDGSSIVFNCRIENLAIDCNGVAGSTGIYSTEANEQSGAFRVLVYNVIAYGIEFGGSGAQQFSLIDGEVYFKNGVDCSAAIGIHINAPGGNFTMQRWTVNGTGASVEPTYLMRLRTSFGVMSDLHFEHGTNGLSMGGGGFSSNGFVASGILGGPSLTNTVRIESTAGVTQGFTLLNVVRNGATNAILDADRSITLTDSQLPIYQVGSGTAKPVWYVNANAVTLAGTAPLMLGTAGLYHGSGSPESVVAAAIGSLYLRSDGSTSTTLYVKTSGASTTGWTAK